MAKYYVFLMDSRVVQISTWLVESEYNQPIVNECDHPIEGALIIEDPGVQAETISIGLDDAQKLLKESASGNLPVTFNGQMLECLHNVLNLTNFMPYEEWLKTWEK